MIDDALSRSACGCLSHLEVCKLLQCGGEVVYLEGLNGHLEPLWFSLPKQPIWEVDPHSESTSKLALLQVNLLRIIPQQFSMPILSPHSAMECPSDMVSCPSMTTEIEELFSIAMPNTSEQLPGGISPRRPVSTVPNVPTISGEEIPLGADKIDSDSPKRIPPSPQWSSQTGMADDSPHKLLTFSAPHARDPWGN